MVIILAVFIAAVVIIVCVTNNSKRYAEDAVGVEYIKTMENKNTAEIENSIFEASRQKILDEYAAAIEEDPDAVWEALSSINTVFLGDSRVVGFDVFGFMDESRVMAVAGGTIHLIPDYYEDLQVINPNLLVISYGINDMNNYWIWETLDEYIAELNDTMTTLTEMLPNAYIYVQAIIPVNEVGLETSETWADIPEWNDALEATCEEHGWRFLDMEDLMVGHEDEYAEDGIHLQSTIYPVWAERILMRYLSDSAAAAD